MIQKRQRICSILFYAERVKKQFLHAATQCPKQQKTPLLDDTVKRGVSLYYRKEKKEWRAATPFFVCKVKISYAGLLAVRALVF